MTCFCGNEIPTVEMFGEQVPVAPRCASCQTDLLAEESVRERRAAVEMMLAKSGRSQRLADWSLATYPDDPNGLHARQVALDWLDSLTDPAHLPPNLILHGPVGTGKTGLAWGIVRECCHRLIPARIVNVRDLLAEIREMIGAGEPYSTEDLTTVGVLALDDLGAERVTDFSLDILASLVERRYQRRVPTIVTSNYRMSELAARLGQGDETVGARIVSRLTEGAVQHRLEGIDRRRAS